MKLWKVLDNFSKNMQKVLIEKKEKMIYTWLDSTCTNHQLHQSIQRHFHEQHNLIGGNMYSSKIRPKELKRMKRLCLHIANREMMLYDRLEKGLK